MSFYSRLPLEELTQFVSQNPNEVDLRLALVEHYVRAGKLHEALTQARLAENLVSHDPYVLAWKSLCLVFLGELEEGYELLNSTTRRFPCDDFRTRLVEDIMPTFVDQTLNGQLVQPWKILEFVTDDPIPGELGERISSINRVVRILQDGHEVGLPLLREHVAKFPNDLNARLFLGGVCLERKLLDEAIQCYRDVIQLDDQCATAYFDLAVIVDDVDEAIRLSIRGLKLCPSQLGARYNLGSFLIQRTRFKEAREQFTRIPGDSSFYADAVLATGICYEHEGDLDAAANSIEIASRLMPKRAEVRAKFGQLLMDLGDSERAVCEFGVAVELDPDLACAWTNKGIIHFECDEDELAIEAFQNALRTWPGAPTATINLSILLKRSGRKDEAVEILLDGYKATPGNSIICQNLGAHYCDVGDLKQSIYFSQRAVELDGTRSGPFWNLANAFAIQKKRDECLKNLRRAIEIDHKMAERFQSDTDFAFYWDDPCFIALTQEKV